MPSDATQAFCAARDFLSVIAMTMPPPTQASSGPSLMASDWRWTGIRDQIAAGDRRNQTALWVAYEDGHEDKLTFAELSERSQSLR